MRGNVSCAASKKNKSKKSNDGGGNGEQQQQQQPARITGKKNGMSVHTQIKLVDRWRKASNEASSQLTSLNGAAAKANRSTTSTTQTTVKKTNGNPANDAYQAELKRRRVLAAEKRKKEREAYARKMALDANDASLGAFFDLSLIHI